MSVNRIIQLYAELTDCGETKKDPSRGDEPVGCQGNQRRDRMAARKKVNKDDEKIIQIK